VSAHMLVMGSTNSASNLGCVSSSLSSVAITCCHFRKKCLKMYLLCIMIIL
jgi:hypothetical protein